MFPLTEDNMWMHMEGDELARSKRKPEDLTGRKVEVLKLPLKPFIPSMPTDYLEKLIDYMQDRYNTEEDSTCLKRAPRLGQLIVKEHDAQIEADRAEQEDGLIAKWLETSLGDAKYTELFASVEDNTL